MGGLVGLPLRRGGLERAAGAPRDPGLLALLVAHLGRLHFGRLLCGRTVCVGDWGRARSLDALVGRGGASRVSANSGGVTCAGDSVVRPAAAAAANHHWPQRRPTRAGPRRAARRRAVLRAAPSASRLPLAVSVSSAITLLWMNVRTCGRARRVSS